VLSLQRRRDLIANARAAQALIIEDDYDSEFRHDGPPLSCMQGLEADAPVLYLGTFSKTMFPALRLGFVVVPAALVEPLSALLSRTAPRGRAADQLALAGFMQSGQFSLHLRRMRRLYRQRRDALVAALEQQLGHVADVYGGSAGMHLALRLRNPEADDAAMSKQLLSLGVVAPALSPQAVGQRVQPWRGFLLGYAQVPVEQMPALVGQLAKVVRGNGLAI
jgi:GntR family transcriptional regulator/MocR family aminotransferase